MYRSSQLEHSLGVYPAVKPALDLSSCPVSDEYLSHRYRIDTYAPRNLDSVLVAYSNM